jgi:RNA polymerase-binding transcription factor DksA
MKRSRLSSNATARGPLYTDPITPNTPNSVGAPRIDPHWAWHYRTLQDLRDRLLRAHAEHAEQVASPAEMRGADVADNARDELDRDLLWAELGTEDDRLFEIDSALNRLREGTYGICEETGRPISEARLRAVPWTRYSRAAAEKYEKPSSTA